MSEPDYNDIEVLAHLPGKDIYGVPVGNLVNAIESGADTIAALRSQLTAMAGERDEAVGDYEKWKRQAVEATNEARALTAKVAQLEGLYAKSENAHWVERGKRTGLEVEMATKDKVLEMANLLLAEGKQALAAMEKDRDRQTEIAQDAFSETLSMDKRRREAEAKLTAQSAVIEKMREALVDLRQDWHNISMMRKPYTSTPSLAANIAKSALIRTDAALLPTPAPAEKPKCDYCKDTRRSQDWEGPETDKRCPHCVKPGEDMDAAEKPHCANVGCHSAHDCPDCEMGRCSSCAPARTEGEK